jgi:hypothetical protein
MRICRFTHALQQLYPLCASAQMYDSIFERLQTNSVTETVEFGHRYLQLHQMVHMLVFLQVAALVYSTSHYHFLDYLFGLFLVLAV